MTAEEASLVREEIERIVASGALGRSRTYSKLLAYLVDCTLEGRTPKELEIAVEVFGKSADFDPNQDSLVRVYMHNLRQKLEQYGAQRSGEESYRLAIPRGEYRLIIEPTRAADAELPPPVTARPRGWVVAAVGLLVLNLAILAYVAFDETDTATPAARIAESQVWAGMLNDDIPLLVVVGDYYIFAELDDYGSVRRLIRDFSINSAKDLDDLFMYSPELTETYYDLDLTYLPQASAYALTDLLRVIYAANKSVRVTQMSQLSTADLKNSHVIYVGYISALETLMEFVFASSNLAVGRTYDELIDQSTGDSYTSGAGMLRYDQRNYRDYGLFSTFPGPGDNRFMIVSGTRDAGVMHVAQALTTAAGIAVLERRLAEEGATAPLAFDALYEVNGFDRMNLDAMLVYWGSLDYQRIWGGDLLQ